MSLRLLQGLALGVEYGGAATYVAEHAPNNRRGYDTSWIQTTATLGFFLALAVIGGALIGVLAQFTGLRAAAIASGLACAALVWVTTRRSVVVSKPAP